MKQLNEFGTQDEKLKLRGGRLMRRETHPEAGND
jgi:hypothetical protein